jgi:hypothetical protein
VMVVAADMVSPSLMSRRCVGVLEILRSLPYLSSEPGRRHG